MLLVAQASFLKDQHARLSLICSMQGFWFVSIAIFAVHSAFPAKSVSAPPPSADSHTNFWLRFLCLPTGRTNSADILWTPRARPFGAL